MAVELDRTTFRRLVWLHVAVGSASLLAVAPQYLSDRWQTFSLAFEALVDQQLGVDTTPAAVAIAFAGIAIGAFVWMIASIVGLLRFRSWGRTGTVASTALLLVLYPLALGSRPTFTSAVEVLLTFVDSALFGAIVLLAYAKGHGADWFARSAAD